MKLNNTQKRCSNVGVDWSITWIMGVGGTVEGFKMTEAMIVTRSNTTWVLLYINLLSACTHIW